MKNILIVNYNTQKLTDACIKSINKHTPNANIFIFDNSDKEKYVNTFSNVTIFDNTEGQLINFESWLNTFPEHEKSPIGSKNNYASSKHCASIQKAIDLIGDNIILMDSDVLIKKDISELWDEKCIYVGGYEHNKWHDKRLMPFICFINVKMCKELGIKYFDENRIVGLTINGEKYDTGCSFYVDSQKYNHKEINIYDYIIHYAQGSWKRKNDENEKKWLEENKHLWSEEPDNVKIFICAHRDFKQAVYSKIYETINAKDINKEDIAYNGLKGSFYSEILTYKWVAENKEIPQYVGFCGYRKYFNFLDNIPDMDDIFSKYGCITASPIKLKETAKENYKRFHNVEDFEIAGKIINDKFPEYKKSFEFFSKEKILIPYNMFIMRREDFKEYIKFIFNILDEYLNYIGTTDIIKRIEDNKDKYIKDYPPNNDINYQYRIGGYLAERLTNVFIFNKFKKIKTYPVKFTEFIHESEKKATNTSINIIRIGEDGLLVKGRGDAIIIYKGKNKIYSGSFSELIEIIKKIKKPH